MSDWHKRRNIAEWARHWENIHLSAFKTEDELSQYLGFDKDGEPYSAPSLSDFALACNGGVPIGPKVVFGRKLMWIKDAVGGWFEYNKTNAGWIKGRMVFG